MRSRTLAVLALANPSFTKRAANHSSVIVSSSTPGRHWAAARRRPKPHARHWPNGPGRIAGLEVRFVEAGEADGETDGTRLFSALSAALADVPPDRVAGAIFITDGRVHDVPTEIASLGFTAPLHALITGKRDERDRRVALLTAPRFGLVGQSQSIVFRVEDQGVRGAPARVTVRRDGEVVENRNVVVVIP